MGCVALGYKRGSVGIILRERVSQGADAFEPYCVDVNI